MGPYSAVEVQHTYNTVLKWFTLSPFLGGPLSFLIDAPFGRFTPKDDSIFLVDGIKAWIVMELVSPLTFLFAFTTSPLSHSSFTLSPALPPLFSRRTLLAALYLIHYTNRALISPLRTPSRSKSHIIVPLFAVAFNLVNATLMGSWLSSPAAAAWHATVGHTQFWAGVALWAAGFVGNVVHDEILLNIRRNHKAKKVDEKKKGEHYAIPHGYLYSLVSYPNYLCEWIEWAGFALAAAPLPLLASSVALSATFSRLAGIGPGGLTPPWTFFAAEVLTMLPRAVKGHAWYKERFGEQYPKERRAVVPFLI